MSPPVCDYIEERQDALPGRDVEQVFLRKYPYQPARRAALRQRRPDQPERAQGEALPRRPAGHGRRPGGHRVRVRPLPARPRRRRRGSRSTRSASPKGELRQRARRSRAASCSCRSTSGSSRRASRPRSARPATARRARSWRWTRATARCSRWARTRRFDPNGSRKPITPGDVRQRSLGEATRRAAVQPRDQRRLSDRLDVQADHALAALETRRHHADDVVDDNGCVHDRRATSSSATPASAAYGPVACARRCRSPPTSTSTRSGRELNSPRDGQPLQTVGAQPRPRAHDRDRPARRVERPVPTARGATRVNRAEARPAAERKSSQPAASPTRARGRVGDNVNLAVGQGDLQATPLQMAVAYAAIANGGHVVAPAPRPARSRTPPGALLQQHRRRRRPRTSTIDPAYRQAILDGLHAAADAAGRHVVRRLQAAGRDASRSTARPAPRSAPARHDQSWYVGLRRPTRDRADRRRGDVENGGFGAEAAAPGRAADPSKWFDVKKRQVRRRELARR